MGVSRKWKVTSAKPVQDGETMSLSVAALGNCCANLGKKKWANWARPAPSAAAGDFLVHSWGSGRAPVRVRAHRVAAGSGLLCHGN